MTTQSWSQASLPEEQWTTGVVSDHTSFMHPSGGDWQSQGAPITAQEIQALDAAAWMTLPQGTVDMGLSPVLSHESQSSHTLNSLSEPDMSMLPPSLDLSFATEPSWNPVGPMVYSSTQAVPHVMSGNCYLPAQAPVTYSPHMEMPSGFAAPQSAFPHVHQPLYYTQGTHAAYHRPAATYQPIVHRSCLLYTSPSPRDGLLSRMPSSA